MPRLLIATTNGAKVREYRRLLADLPLELVAPDDPPKVEETGATFEENALIKARAYADWSGLPSLGDDGGIEIDALGGEPGVRSARWLGRAASDDELIAYALERMRGVPAERRGAQMRVAIALVLPAPPAVEVVGQGIVRGVIAEQPLPLREPGFPFRSVFVPSGGAFDQRAAALEPIRLRLLTHLLGCPDPR